MKQQASRQISCSCRVREAAAQHSNSAWHPLHQHPQHRQHRSCAPQARRDRGKAQDQPTEQISNAVAAADEEDAFEEETISGEFEDDASAADERSNTVSQAFRASTTEASRLDMAREAYRDSGTRSGPSEGGIIGLRPGFSPFYFLALVPAAFFAWRYKQQRRNQGEPVPGEDMVRVSPALWFALSLCLLGCFHNSFEQHRSCVSSLCRQLATPSLHSARPAHLHAAH